MLQFKNWFNRNKMKNRLVVFDFDGTIADVPERPTNWKGTDWWGHADSLTPPEYNGTINQEVVDAFHKDKSDPRTHIILLTGRRGIIAHKVRHVLRSQNLFGKRIIPDSNKDAQAKHQSMVDAGHDEFHPHEKSGHEQYFSGDHVTEPDFPKTAKGKSDGSTVAHKIYVINKVMNPNIEIVEFWDDRADHAPHFIKLGLDLLNKYGEDNGGKLRSVMFHRVFKTPGGVQIQHIPIKAGMVY